jgi:mono/diheme cytochrome c family protein
MFTFLKRILTGLLLVAVIAAAAVYGLGEMQIQKKYTVAAEAIPIPTDAESIARGKHLMHAIAKCTDCHGEGLKGGTMIDDPMFGRLVAPNLTTGAGGVGGQLRDEDWVRAVRHGVMLDGKSVAIMPSNLYNAMSERDLGSLIAYAKSLPPVDNTTAATQLGFLSRLLLVTGQAHFLSAAVIQHDAPPPPAPDPGISVTYGKYLATIGGCVECHTPSLGGGPVPGAPPDAPKALNISQGGEPGTWTDEQFKTTLRTGTNPAGRKLDPDWMPWKAAAEMTDDEISAVWMYLKSMPPVKSGSLHGRSPAAGRMAGDRSDVRREAASAQHATGACQAAPSPSSGISSFGKSAPPPVSLVPAGYSPQRVMRAHAPLGFSVMPS